MTIVCIYLLALFRRSPPMFQWFVDFFVVVLDAVVGRFRRSDWRIAYERHEVLGNKLSGIDDRRETQLIQMD